MFAKSLKLGQRQIELGIFGRELIEILRGGLEIPSPIGDRAGAPDGFIARLKDGYKAEVRERGAGLSVGQKQLISFARALAFDPALLILDEATSSIDTETEQLIQRAIERVMRDRTSIVVAHRLSTIQNADRIIVLHHGEIREQGTHQELLAERGLYWKLYKLQYADSSYREAVT